MNELLAMVKATANELEDVLHNPAEYLENMGYDEDEDALFMWFNDVLDVEIISGMDKSYRGTKLYVTLGGPTIWIDTSSHTIEGRWGIEKESMPLYTDVCDMLDDYVSEIAGWEY